MFQRALVSPSLRAWQNASRGCAGRIAGTIAVLGLDPRRDAHAHHHPGSGGGQSVARRLPFTYAVSLLRGLWHEGWPSHLHEVAVLALMLVVFVAVSAKVFRWE